MPTAEWRKAIEGYLAHERAGGKRTSTSAARRQHLEHLARRVNVGPWQVTTDTLLDYLAAQTWASETRRGRRTTFGRFYAWARAAFIAAWWDMPSARPISGHECPAARASDISSARRAGIDFIRRWKADSVSSVSSAIHAL